MVKKSRLLVLFVSLLFLAAIAGRAWAAPGESASSGVSEPLEVFADILPVAYLVEQVGGRHVSVETLVPANSDPHVFEPTPRQVVALSAARLYFSADLPLDRQILAKIGSLGGGSVYVDATAGIEKHAAACGPDCKHGDRHDHGGRDPHVWLSPPLLKKMAENVAAALERADSAHAADYRENLKRLAKQIEETDRAAGRRLAPHRGKTFYVFHPAFGYMAAHYGLKQRAVQLEGRSPSSRHLQSLIKEAKTDRAAAVFAQGQFDLRPAQIVAGAIGAEVVTINPLAKDVLANLDYVSKILDDVMKN